MANSNVLKRLQSLIWIFTLFLEVSSAFGPPYPVTGSWFKERFSLQEWNTTLHQFSKEGGDTVLLRAPPLVLTTRDEMVQNPDFQWCYGSGKFGERRFCVDDALAELNNLGLSVTNIATYRHEDAVVSNALLKCPKYDKMITGGRIYHRIVLPLSGVIAECDFNKTDVMVLFMSFAGIDSQDLLLTTAQEYNMSVFLGLPSPPNVINSHGNFLMAHSEFISRILMSQQKKRHINKDSDDKKNDVVSGYFWSNDIFMSDIHKLTPSGGINLLSMLKNTAFLTHNHGKLFGVSTTVNLNKLYARLDLHENIAAFERLATEGHVDIISVKDGRGSGTSGLYWPTEVSEQISTIDRGLYDILKMQFPNIPVNNTFQDVFTHSTNEIFVGLANSTEYLKKNGTDVELWLNIEAYDLLYDDPCLPVDHSGSGNSRMANRVTKSRLDRVLTHAGAAVTKVVSFAWDPEFTCTTTNHTYPLRNEVQSDMDRPIIASCGFHSSFNRSVVVIGYNLLQETQSFTMNWPNVNGHRVQSQVYGYYFELDWGIQHHRVPSLMYIQMYDPYDVVQLAPKGYVKIIAQGSYHGCAFKYDFTEDGFLSNLPKYESRKSMKKFVRETTKPHPRIEAQDSPFTD